MKTQLQNLLLSAPHDQQIHTTTIYLQACKKRGVLIWYSVIMQIKSVHRDYVTQIWKRIMMSLITGSRYLTPPHAVWLGIYCNWETDYKYSPNLNIVRGKRFTQWTDCHKSRGFTFTFKCTKITLWKYYTWTLTFAFHYFMFPFKFSSIHNFVFSLLSVSFCLICRNHKFSLISWYTALVCIG